MRMLMRTGAFLSLWLLAAAGAAAACLNPNDDPQLCETREILFASGEGQRLQDKALELGTPDRIYEYLRNNADYALYHGARSNAINTFLSLRGNDVDLASALIAMLRSQGIKAHYVVGDVRISKDELSNWLGVLDNQLAVSLLRDQGIQDVDDTHPEYVTFEHVWVEALVEYASYRGGGPSAQAACALASTSCKWIPLDVSFKQKRHNDTPRTLLRGLAFDYDAYYNAQNPASPDYLPGLKNKSPLEIFEEQALDYLKTNHPGVSLEDLADAGEIIRDESGLLPASLPYQVAGAVTRYDSVDAHDVAEAIDWTKYLRTEVRLSACPGNVFSLLPTYTVTLADLSTKRLTVTLFDSGGSTIWGHRLDGQPVGTTITLTSIENVILRCSDGSEHVFEKGTAVDLKLAIDVEPGRDPVEVDYNNLVVGGYYLVASGGETSNWTQVKRAARELLQANQDYRIVVDESGALGTAGTAYVDENGNALADVGDTPLLEHLPAQDALTGGLLYVAQSLYYTRLREDSERYGRLTGMISPISAYLGVVSTVDEVEYLHDVPFAVTPGGLLIDLKGIRLNGTWEVDQPESYSSETFRVLGHIGSSLEHEVWQEITGYDAISTVRGIQFALEQGRELLDVKHNGTEDTYPASLLSLGFANGPPGDFIRHDRSLFGRQLVSWGYSGQDPVASFNVFRPNIEGLTADDAPTLLATYRSDNGIDSFYANYDSFEDQFIQDSASEGWLKTNQPLTANSSAYSTYDVVSAYVTGDSGFAVQSYSRQSSTQYRFIVNETSNHPDGVVNFGIQNKLADSVDEVTAGISGAGGVTITSVVARTAGFGVKTWYVSGGTLYVVLKETGSHGNGLYNVQFEVYIFVNGLGSLSAGVFSYNNLEIIGNRFVDGSFTSPLQFAVDVSDDQTLTCPGGPNGEPVEYIAPPSVLLGHLEGCFNNIINLDGNGDFVTFFDKSAGFDPDTYAYRSTLLNLDEYDIDFIVKDVRSAMYGVIGSGWYQYVLPSRLPQDTHYLFSVYLRNFYDGADHLATSTYAIVNHSDRLIAGGGYVTAEDTLEAATSEDFNNEVFTNLSTVSLSNNDLVRTPSTADPVSTVTGNMYHDETDVVIKGRGLDYAFTRTYNSENAEEDGPLGHGWNHSYGVRLVSNDYGKHPNFLPAAAPENGNGTTSSISNVDERGGAHNYLVDDLGGTYAVSSPLGTYDTLTLDTAPGEHTLTFRNGARYVFEVPPGGGDLRTTPGVTARLARIEDPYGNVLRFTYDAGGRLERVQDNLGIAGRDGLLFSYNGAETRIATVSDWSGRTWRYDYDGAGNLTSMTNPLADAVTYTYHPDTHWLHELISPALRGGQRKTTAFSYYENGQAYAYVDQLGNEESLSYDLFRKRTRITNPRGFITEHHYDANGGLVKLRQPDGALLSFDNNADGQRYSKTDGLGYQTRYSYRADRSLGGLASDTGGLVTLEQDPLGHTVEYDYGLYDQPARIQDKNGQVHTLAYYTVSDAASGAVAGRLKESRATVGGVPDVLLESYTYYADGNLKRKVEAIDPAAPGRQRITDYEYDPAGLNLTRITVSGSGQSIVTEFGYDELGRKTGETRYRRSSATDPALLALTTTFEYDALGRITRVTDPLGNIAETVYDPNGQVYQEKTHHEQAGGSFAVRTYKTYAFDAADRLISETDIDGNLTRYGYDEMGNPLTRTDANGHTTRYEYDVMGRKTAVIDANGHRTEMTYDLAGRLIEQRDPNGAVTQFSYDANGRLTSTTSPAGRETRSQYDPNGNLTHTTDANAVAGTQPTNSFGATVYREYDELGRLTRSVNAEDGVTLYSYDLLGNHTAITDAEGRTTRFVYDDLGRLIETIDPLVETPTDRTETYTYDEAGNLLTETDRKGQVTRFTYDALNRLTLTEYLADASSDSRGYDSFGNLTTLANEAVTYTYGYDHHNRLTSKTDSRANRSLTWTYGPVGNILTKTDYQGEVTTYQYDSTNRLVSLTNPAYLQVSYHYDPAGRLLNRILSNGAKTDYGYDTDGRLVSLSNKSADGTEVHREDFVHDHVGNITQVTDAAGTIIYTYDPVYRLTQADYPGTADDVSYTYDKIGNRLTQTTAGGTRAYLYDAGNRLTAVRDASPTGPVLYSYEYDDNGNRTAKNDAGGAPIHSAVFDPKDRIARLTAGGTTYDFAYDANDYRIEKSGGGSTRQYHLEAEHLEAVYDGAGTLKEKHLRGVVVDEVVNGYHYHSADANDWSNYTYHHDHLRSVAALTGHAGSTEQTVQYGPFGEALSSTGDSDNRMLYTGREADAEFGLYYYRARYYDPEVGRFISEDPLGFAAGVNFYAYVGNNPINANDPMGEDGVNLGISAKLLGEGITNTVSIRYPGVTDEPWDLQLQTGLSPGIISQTIIGWLDPENPFAQSAGIELVKGTVNLGWDFSSNVGSGVNMNVDAHAGWGLLGGTATYQNMLDNDVPIPSSFELNLGPQYGVSVSPEADLTVSVRDIVNIIGEQFSSSTAGGGYVLYPNKPNTNTMQTVYQK